MVILPDTNSQFQYFLNCIKKHYRFPRSAYRSNFKKRIWDSGYKNLPESFSIDEFNDAPLHKKRGLTVSDVWLTSRDLEVFLACGSRKAEEFLTKAKRYLNVKRLAYSHLQALQSAIKLPNISRLEVHEEMHSYRMIVGLNQNRIISLTNGFILVGDHIYNTEISLEDYTYYNIDSTGIVQIEVYNEYKIAAAQGVRRRDMIEFNKKHLAEKPQGLDDAFTKERELGPARLKLCKNIVKVLALNMRYNPSSAFAGQFITIGG